MNFFSRALATIYCRIAIIFIFYFTLLPNGVLAQTERKVVGATRITDSPLIDGLLNETVWYSGPTASDFYQYEPHNDRSASFATVVRVLYDDNYLYIGAKMYDNEPDQILSELSLRDGVDGLNADKFVIDFNPFDDGLYAFSFRVSASNVQADVNISHGAGGNGDHSWNAVWVSATSITETGWVAEIKIPYSALRFPTNGFQEWGINFWREIRRKREWSSWNFVDRSIGNPVASMGLLTGIANIEPPLRLSLFPFTSGYIENDGSGNGWLGTINGGMDVKWGINESFTVDMTLIPDFGQVQTDERVLNLSPFEIRHDENRQFFTEGTELFNKAHLFYSRRIGARPSGYRAAYNALQENEIMVANPLESRLINASKLSGRTASGFGVGVLNAMTAPSRATLRDTITGIQRDFITQPFTNYNIVVVDQSLMNNSFISLINTNVLGRQEGYMANVTGTDFSFNDNSGLFRISGEAALSQQYYSSRVNISDIFGYKYALRAGKYGGTWQYNYTREAISNTFNQNDLGFLRRNNLVADHIGFSYNIYQPFWRLLNFRTGFSAYYSRLYKPGKFSYINLSYHLGAESESRNSVFLMASYRPFGTVDHFEPRVPGRYFDIGRELSFFLRGSSDSQRRLHFDGDVQFRRTYSAHNQYGYSFDIGPFFRVNDRIRLGYEIEREFDFNDIGYIDHVDANNIFFGKRNITTTENELQITSIFSNSLSFDLNLRHYWTMVDYQNVYFFLEPDGQLRAYDNPPVTSQDINYNAFTIDARLTWNFAPGSQMTLVWKNLIDSEQDELLTNYFKNARNFLDDPQINSLSLKILYYIDSSSFLGRRS